MTAQSLTAVSQDVAIQVTGLTHEFSSPYEPRNGPAEASYALIDIELSIPRGQFLAIVGPSGCGKTTLMNMMAGLLTPSRGNILRDGVPPISPARNVGYMFARPGLLPWRDALANVELGLEFRGVRRRESRSTAEGLLDEVGLSKFSSSLPAELSQGMRQRVALARVLALNPDYLLMDEPFGALDAQTKLVVQELFIKIWEGTGKTVVFVTHDLVEAASLADRVIVMTASPGRIKADITLPFKRPRMLEELRFDPEFQDISQQIWTALKDEVAHDV